MKKAGEWVAIVATIALSFWLLIAFLIYQGAIALCC